MSRNEAIAQLTTSIPRMIYHKFRRCMGIFYSWTHLAWLVLIVAAINVICIGGKRRAFGVFIAALDHAFNGTSMAELNWIGDSYAALGFFLMPFATTLIVKMNRPYRLTMFTAGIVIFISCITSANVPDPSYLFLTHTLFHGIGSTLVLCGTSLVTGDYFDKTHRFHVLATAFVSGGPYGVLIFGPLFSYWCNVYGWRIAFTFCGVLFLIVTWLASIVFLPRYMFDYAEAISDNKNLDEDSLNTANEQKQTESEGKPPLLLKDAPKASDGRGWAFCSISHLKENPQAFAWAVERLAHNIVIYGLLMNMTNYVSKSLNNNLIRGARVNTYFGIGESLVFTLGAFIGDRIRGYLVLVYLIGSISAAIFLLIIQHTYTDINVIYVLAGFTGASIGVGNTFLYATTEEVLLVHGSIAFPMTKMVAGIGMLLAPVFSGSVIDAYGYRGFFICMALLVCVRVLLLTLIWFILRRKHTKAAKVELERTNALGKMNHSHACCEKPQNSTTLVKDHSEVSEQVGKLSDEERRINESAAWYNATDNNAP